MSSRFVAGKVLGAPDQDGRFGAQLQHFLCTTADGNGCFSTKTNDAVKLESCCRVKLLLFHEESVCLRTWEAKYAGHLADILMQPKPKKISPPFPYHGRSPSAFPFCDPVQLGYGYHPTLPIHAYPRFRLRVAWNDLETPQTYALLCGFVMFCLKRGGYLDCRWLQF